MEKLNRRAFVTWGATLGLAGPLWACLSPGQQRQDALLRISREMNNDLRWGRYETAVSHFEPAAGLAFLKRVDLVEDDLVIADHEMTSIKFDEPPVKAKTIVHFEWYTKRDPVVHKTSVEQTWEHREGAWALTKQRRLRGERFPLVTEPAEKTKATADAEPLPEPPAP
ncbi:MAG: hypothetical protein KA712_01615 [Myxococcales bacterium]|nr:hypothetical protein [Myxococcales bacterium]